MDKIWFSLPTLLLILISCSKENSCINRKNKKDSPIHKENDIIARYSVNDTIFQMGIFYNSYEIELVEGICGSGTYIYNYADNGIYVEYVQIEDTINIHKELYCLNNNCSETADVNFGKGYFYGDSIYFPISYLWSNNESGVSDATGGGCWGVKTE